MRLEKFILSILLFRSTVLSSFTLSCIGFMFAKLPTFEINSNGIQQVEQGSFLTNITAASGTIDVCIIGLIGVGIAVLVPLVPGGLQLLQNRISTDSYNYIQNAGYPDLSDSRVDLYNGYDNEVDSAAFEKNAVAVGVKGLAISPAKNKNVLEVRPILKYADLPQQGVGSYEEYYNPQSPVQEYYSPQTPIQEYYSPQSPVQEYYSSQKPTEDYGPVITADNYKPVRASQNYPQGWTGHLESTSGGAEPNSGEAEPVYKYHVKAGQEPTLHEKTPSKKKSGSMINLQGFLIPNQDEKLAEDDIVAVYPQKSQKKEDDGITFYTDSAAFSDTGAYPGTPQGKTSDEEDFSQNQGFGPLLDQDYHDIDYTSGSLVSFHTSLSKT